MRSSCDILTRLLYVVCTYTRLLYVVYTYLANIHVCVYIHVFPAELAVQNVVGFFVSTYHESVDTTFSYLLLA